MRIMLIAVWVSLLISCSQQDVKKGALSLNKNASAKTEEVRPAFLYKVISTSDWENSCREIRLSAMDAEFIHLSTQEQLDKIIEKYWSNIDEYVLLKLDSSKLFGELVLEVNPGDTNKYYHLYHGSIPFSAIVELNVKK